ncbi:MAG: 3-hydroxyisobutyrate dehydrogenase [Geminicoccaceae bacterium]
MAQQKSCIAFIGLGNMGAPMARNLLAAGHYLAVHDINPDASAALDEAGARVAESVIAAAEGTDVVITMLPAGRHVEAVYLGERGLLTVLPKTCLAVDCSTIDVATARKVHDHATERGVDLLDAPVSGGAAGAEAGTLTFMVGGSARAFERARPYLEVMGKSVIHAGEAGAGQTAKICNNMILGISMIGVCEAFALADSLGLAPEKLFEISASSSGQCWSLTTYCPVPGPVPASPANRDYAPGFTAEMMLKDLKLAQQAANAGGVATPLGAAACQLYQLLDSSGCGKRDFSFIIKMIEGKL